MVIAYDRRFASRALRGRRGRGPPGPRHPGRLRSARGADPDELVRGRRARRRRRHRHHGQPQPVDRQRVQGQGADRARRPGRTSWRSSRRRSRPTAATAIERRPFADAEAAGLVERFDPYEGYERYVRRTLDLDALKAADVLDPRRADVGRRGRLDLAPARRRQDPGHRDPPGAQPVLRRRQPGADPARTSTRPWASSPAAATTSA